MAQPVETDREALARQLAGLTDVCSCRLNAECRQLMDQLAYRGVLPAAVLTMSDEDWLEGCRLTRQRTGQT